ncbi:MAG: NAD(P)/FAD-dependent oxidoreductase [Oscillospiraceae bacterium]|nr:NAD(P)/FAD-dependent oxidoreductase [Oscillospiraceae bacterium]
MNYVIIGNSAAAVGAIVGIRANDQTGKITVISDEPYHTYSRPLISYWLQGKVTDEKIYYREPDFYEKNRVSALLGKKAAAICPEQKEVVLDDGSRIPYDKLLVAAGSSPFVPPMKGLETVKNQSTFLSYDDAQNVKRMVSEDSRVLIVGAGLIGLKAAEALEGKCAEMTVVDLADRILPSILDLEGSAIMQKHIESKGVRFILGQSVSEFNGNKAALKNGDALEFDVLIIAVGVRPNTALIADAGGKVDRGICTDDRQLTSLKDVYAAGDCTVSHDISGGTDRILALLPNAYRQGEVAGCNMAKEGSAVYDKAIPMNAIGFFGLHIITAGAYQGECYARQSEKGYKKLFYQDNLLKGFILIGEVDRAGIYTSMIREQTPLDSVNRELLFESPALMAFGKPYRLEKLGGIKGE